MAANSSEGSVKVNSGHCIMFHKIVVFIKSSVKVIRPDKKVCVEVISLKFTQMDLVYNKTGNVRVT